jgi:hypothetical protein
MLGEAEALSYPLDPNCLSIPEGSATPWREGAALRVRAGSFRSQWDRIGVCEARQCNPSYVSVGNHNPEVYLHTASYYH